MNSTEFCSCAPLQHRKNVIQRTVHRDFKATYNLLAFDQALEKHKTCPTKNQYPDEWPSKIVDQTSAKIMIGSKCQLKPTPKEHQKIKIRSHDKHEIFLQYTSNLTQIFAGKLKKLCYLQVVFIKRKLRS